MLALQSPDGSRRLAGGQNKRLKFKKILKNNFLYILNYILILFFKKYVIIKTKMGIFSKKDKEQILSEVERFKKMQNTEGKKTKGSFLKNSNKPFGTSPIKERISLKPSAPERKQHHTLRKIILGIVAFVIIVGGIFIYRVTSVGHDIFSNGGSFWGQVKEFIFGDGKSLKTDEGQTNILLLGIGGEEHKGGNLADTIMVVAIKEKEKKVAVLSIPRDLYVKVPDEDYYTKINAVHTYGELKKKGNGPKEMMKIVEEVTGLPIHYYGRIDFIAFKKIIDELGGIDIDIEESFYDYWHQISFMKGTEHMDGERALAYVRARYVEGPEGGDIARGRRTQQVLRAVGNKVVQIPVWDIKTVNSVMGTLGNHAKTNLRLTQLKHLYELSKEIDQNNIINVVMDTGPNGILQGATENLGGETASVLKTRTGDYSEIQELAQNLFDQPSSFDKVTPKAPPVEITEKEKEQKEEKAILEIRNGTTINGFAGRVSTVLKEKGFEVKSIGNAATQDNTKTIIYDLSGGEKPTGLQGVKNNLGVTQTKTALPSGEASSSADFVIILGTDISDKFK